MEEKKSTQQTDGHSCGVFTIMHASKLAANIANKGNSKEVYEIGIGSKDDIVKTRNWLNEIITNIDLADDNKKGQTKEPDMLFYKEMTIECWFHTNGHCRYENKCINVHKIRCLEKFLTGQCNNKNCTKGHPIVCRNIEKERTCNRYNAGKCPYLHPINYYRQDRGYQNNRGVNNRSVNNNEVNNNNPYNSSNNNSNGYYNGYGGHEEWNWGNNRTNFNNRNNTGYNTGYMEYDDRNRWGNGNGREENFHTERNYYDEWPTPWEGRILRMMERIEQRMEENRWRQSGW